MESAEPTMRNSNRLPVKAKGEVRFRSVASRWNTGTVETPVSRVLVEQEAVLASPLTIRLTRSSS